MGASRIELRTVACIGRFMVVERKVIEDGVEIDFFVGHSESSPYICGFGDSAAATEAARELEKLHAEIGALDRPRKYDVFYRGKSWYQDRKSDKWVVTAYDAKDAIVQAGVLKERHFDKVDIMGIGAHVDETSTQRGLA